jgi:hypothetical protein
MTKMWLRAVPLAATIALVLAGCSSGSAKGPAPIKEPIPIADIDQAALSAQLKAVAPGSNPDMSKLSKLYDLTVEQCKEDLDQMTRLVALQLDDGETVAIDATRVMMQAVCPSRAHMVDDAVTNSRDALALANQACPSNEKSQWTYTEAMVLVNWGCK